jgi:hypothetical protein
VFLRGNDEVPVVAETWPGGRECVMGRLVKSLSMKLHNRYPIDSDTAIPAAGVLPSHPINGHSRRWSPGCVRVRDVSARRARAGDGS